MKLMANKQGFALPTVMIASIVMLMVLLSSLTATSSISAGIRSQYYNKLAQEAAEAGLAKAKTCLEQTNTALWSNGSPLHSNTGCSGGASCNSGSTCFLINSTNVQTTFTVGSATLQADGSYTLSVTGTAQLLRTSTGAQLESYSTQSAVQAIPVYWRSISAGTNFSCGMTLSTSPTYDDKLKCWGNNGGGYKFGNKTSNDSLIPVNVARDGVLNGLTVQSFSSGLANSCAIANTYAYCWGSNSQDGLGDNTTSNRTSPVAVYTGGVLSGKTISAVATGSNDSCVIASDNKVYCWGENLHGAVGDGTTTPRPGPVAVSTAGVLSGKTITSIELGNMHACVTASDGKIYCWGLGSGLGNSTYTDSSVPVAVTATGVLSGKTISAVALGNSFSCVLASDNKPYCWGSNAKSQLGNGTATDSNVPVAVTVSGALSGKTLTAITAGNQWACVLATDGRAYCWGQIGEFSGSNVINSNVPIAIVNTGVLSGKTLVSISAGYDQTCALDTQGKSYCWGGNSSGQFGNGTTTGSINPVATFNTWQYSLY